MANSINVRACIDVLNEYSRLKTHQNVYLYHCPQCNDISIISSKSQRTALAHLTVFFSNVLGKALEFSNPIELSHLRHAYHDYARLCQEEPVVLNLMPLRSIISKISQIIPRTILKDKILTNVLNFLKLEETSKLQLVSDAFRKSYKGMLKSFFYYLSEGRGGLYSSYMQLKSVDFSSVDYSYRDEHVSLICSLPGLRSLNLKGGHLITDRSFSHIAKAKDLKQLDISYCLMITGAGISALAGLNNLRHLNLYMCKNFYYTSMKEFLNFSKLIDLNLGGCRRIAGDSLKYLIKCKELTFLNLSHCNRLTDTSLYYLVGKTQLRFLDLSECNFTNQGLFTLSGLDIHYLKLGDSDYVDNLSILNAVSGFRSLNTFTLQYCSNVSDEGMLYLSSATNLQQVRLQNLDSITNDGFMQLSSLKDLHMLHVENLSSVSFNGGNLLSNLSNLLSLTLSVQKIKDEGFLEISKLDRLSFLSLSKIKGYTANGFNHLMKLKNLKVLEIQKSPLDFECIAAISKISSLRNLTIGLPNPEAISLAVERLRQLRPDLKVSLTTDD